VRLGVGFVGQRAAAGQQREAPVVRERPDPVLVAVQACGQIAEPAATDRGLDRVGHPEDDQRVGVGTDGRDRNEQVIERLGGPAEPELEQPERPLEYIARHDGVWLTTSDEIAEHYTGRFRT
jgi:hypothetical protein